jgi:Histidine kinase-, DNA gyrase B-, and HSP90-like ATPase
MSYYTQICHSDVVGPDIEKKPTKFKKQVGYPFGDLDPRDFERLVYLLYHTEIENGMDAACNEVRLMQGVGEQGRDCTLYNKVECVGVIQCKRLSSNLDRPTLGKEIIKFTLNSILDDSLRGQVTEFRYIVVVPGLATPAMTLRDEWNTEHFNDDELKTWSTGVINRFQGLRNLSWEKHGSELKEALCSMKIEVVLREDLTLRLNNFPDLVSMFFTVDTVIDKETFEEILENRDRKAFEFQKNLTKVEIDLQKKNPGLFEALEQVKQRYRTEVEDRQPDFSKLTNHKRDHACKLWQNIDRLYKKVEPELTDHELYVLSTSAVLHDVAALYYQEDIEQITECNESVKYQRRYAQRNALSYFSSEHARLGGDLLRAHGVERFLIKFEYLKPIALVASARNIEEMTESAGYERECYTIGGGDEIRIYLLAILIRIAELFDFENICPSLLMQGQELFPGYTQSCTIWNELKRPLTQVNFPTNADPTLSGECDDQNIFLGITRRVQAVSDEIRLARRELSKRSIPITCLALTDLHHDTKSRFTDMSHGFQLDENRVFETLIGDALYGTPLAGIRELLQNAVDACQQRKILDDSYEPKIRVTLHNNSLSVSDNGVGMDSFVIDNFFSRLASTSHQAANIEGFEAVGRFGIGVFSYFLLCDSFEVNTRPLKGEPKKFNASRVLNCPFFYFNEGYREESGTTIKMLIRQDRANLFAEKAVSNYILKIFRYVSIPIEIQTQGDILVVEPSTPKISYQEHIRPFFKIEHAPLADKMCLLSTIESI